MNLSSGSMNPLAPAIQQPLMSSYDFWKQVNQFRAEAGEREIRHNDFLNRVADETGVSNYEKIVVATNNGGSKQIQSVHLNHDEMLLVGMRESKVVRQKVLHWLKALSAPVAQSVSLPDFTNPAEAARAWADEHEAKQLALTEAKRLNQICNTVARQFIPGETAARFCMQLNGVNCQQVQSWLVSRGHLINEGRRGYRPSAQTRDRYFKLFVTDNDGKETYQAQLTQTGARWLYNKYLKGELPMKKTWNGQFTHAVFEHRSPLEAQPAPMIYGAMKLPAMMHSVNQGVVHG